MTEQDASPPAVGLSPAERLAVALGTAPAAPGPVVHPEVDPGADDGPATA